MKRIVVTFIMVMSLMLVAGCVKKKSDSGEDQVTPTEQPVNANYIGQHNGCVQNYDPLFCGPEYAPKGE